MVAGACLLAVAVWWWAPWTTARAVTLAGTAVASGDGMAISFAADSRIHAVRHGVPLREYTGFSVEGVHWAGPDEIWRQGGPVHCLAPMEPTRVEVTFVEVHYGDGPGVGPTRPLLVLRCLD